MPHLSTNPSITHPDQLNGIQLTGNPTRMFDVNRQKLKEMAAARNGSANALLKSKQGGPTTGETKKRQTNEDLKKSIKKKTDKISELREEITRLKKERADADQEADEWKDTCDKLRDEVAELKESNGKMKDQCLKYASHNKHLEKQLQSSQDSAAGRGNHKHLQSKDVTAGIHTFVRGVLARNVKFLPSEHSVESAMTKLWNGIKGEMKLEEAPFQLTFDSFCQIYTQTLVAEISASRQYVQTRGQAAAKGELITLNGVCFAQTRLSLTLLCYLLMQNSTISTVVCPKSKNCSRFMRWQMKKCLIRAMTRSNLASINAKSKC